MKELFLKNGERAFQITTYQELQTLDTLETITSGILGLINFWAKREHLVKPKQLDEIVPSLQSNTFVATYMLEKKKGQLPFLCSYAQAMLNYEGLFYLTSNVTLPAYQRMGFGTHNIAARLAIWQEVYPHLRPVTQVSALNQGIIAVLTGLGAAPIVRPAPIPPDPTAHLHEKLFFDLSNVVL